MSMQSAQRVWVVGHGFLGRVLADACRACGAAVLTIDPAAPADVCGAACDAAALLAAREQLMPTLVFCCMATHGGTAEQYRACYLDTVHALQRHCSGAKIIFCSSISVYGNCGGACITEQTPPRASGERAAVLLAAEQAVLVHGGVVARLAALYGEQRCELRRRHLAGEPQLPGAESRLLHYVHVEDAAAALLLISPLSAALFNVCGAVFTKAAAYAALEQETGVPASATVAPASCRGGVNACVSSAKLLALGWSPRPFFS
ncbi:MAG: NAD-dependent epimerase/dehydratase family protein [Akkermansia sp.]|nr:NAD-dependent epimerase/dehydratase family protein [Akkermansia sp.]